MIRPTCHTIPMRYSMKRILWLPAIATILTVLLLSLGACENDTLVSGLEDLRQSGLAEDGLSSDVLGKNSLLHQYELRGRILDNNGDFDSIRTRVKSWHVDFDATRYSSATSVTNVYNWAAHVDVKDLNQSPEYINVMFRDILYALSFGNPAKGDVLLFLMPAQGDNIDTEFEWKNYKITNVSKSDAKRYIISTDDYQNIDWRKGTCENGLFGQILVNQNSLYVSDELHNIFYNFIVKNDDDTDDTDDTDDISKNASRGCGDASDVELLGFSNGGLYNMIDWRPIPTTTVDFFADPDIIDIGGMSTLSWSSSNATSVLIDQGIGMVAASGTRSVSPDETTEYTITAVGDKETAMATATVTVRDSTLTVRLVADPDTINAGGGSTLRWTASHATSLSINQGVGSVSSSGSWWVSPTSTTTYEITAKDNDGGEVSDSATVTVCTPATVSLYASPNPINRGNSSMLNWSFLNATDVSISPDIGSVSESGTRLVSPTSTTTYTITGTDDCGRVLENQFVVTVRLFPSLSFSASAKTVTLGGSSTLRWSSSNATSVSIDQGIGSVATSGTHSVSPTSTTIYTITATGPGGSVSAQETVTVGDTKPPPSVRLSSSPSAITSGSRSTLSWSSSNATSVSIDQGIGLVSTSGTYSVSPTSTTTYTITATGAGGTDTDRETVTVNEPPPSVSLSASPSAITRGGRSALSWSSSNASSVSISPGIGSVSTSGTHSVSPTSTTTYTITATGAGGTDTDRETVTVNEPPPSVSLSASPSAITRGGRSTLRWSASDASSVSISPGIGSVSTSGTYSVSPTSTTTYTITATGPGGTDTDQAKITVRPPPPSVSLSAAPSTITRGGRSTLRWSASDASSVSISPGIGSVSTSGTRSVSPTSTTTYTITAKGPGGTDTDQAKITVRPPPSVSLSASPSAITRGGRSTLRWSVSNASSVSISPGIGSVSTSGTRSVSPTSTTTYTITAKGSGGTGTARTTVTVRPPPPSVRISASPTTITRGDSSTLSWSSSNATRVSISPGIGSVSTSGTRSVSPTSTTIYEITATGPGGTVENEVIVTVNNPAPTVSLSARPTIIAKGHSSKLTWSSSNATSVSISPGIGAVAASGSRSVSPTRSTTYTITATGPGGTATDQTRVTLRPLKPGERPGN